MPLQRGLFEDYVANFWCVTHPLFKWKRRMSQQTLARVCAAATLTALLPACLHQVLRPSRKGFLYCLVISALSFFMFSYQVRGRLSAHRVGLLCSAAMGMSGAHSSCTCACRNSSGPALHHRARVVMNACSSIQSALQMLLMAVRHLGTTVVHAAKDHSRPAKINKVFSMSGQRNMFVWSRYAK